MPDIFGTTGPDTLVGISGDDTIYGRGGSDNIDAGDGNDTVVIPAQGTGYVALRGGNGTDTLQLDMPQPFNQQLTFGPFGPYYSSVISLTSLASFSSFERLSFNSGLYGPNQMELQLLTSQIGTGLAANAELIGGAGTDTLTLIYVNGGLPGSYTAPTFSYTNWTTPLRPYLSGDRVIIGVSGNGATTLNGSAHAGIQQLSGANGDDIINGSNDMDILTGGGGNNQLYGNGGDDGFLLANNYSYSSQTGPGPETTLTGAGTLFDGGSGTDFMIFGGNVNFSGTVQNMEGIYLQPSYGNTNGSASQYGTNVFMSGSTIASFSSNLIIDGLGYLTVGLADGGASFNGSGYVFEALEFFLTVLGGDGADNIVGTNGNDVIFGGAGGDTINGGDSDDVIHAGFILVEENDYYDILYGIPVLDRGTEVDTLNGGNGDDVIFAGYGDLVDGGADTGTVGDTLYLSLLAASGSLNLDLSAPTLNIGSGSITGIEHIAWLEASNFSDTITAGGNSVFHDDGDGGQTVILGMGGNDNITGCADGDYLAGGTGADTLSGLDGGDYLFSADFGIPEPGATFDPTYDAYVAPILDNGTEIDTLSGGAGNDRLYAGYGDNIDGGADFDELYLSLRGASSGQTIDFTSIPTSIGGGTVSGIESVVWVDGSNFGDTLTLSNIGPNPVAGSLNGFGGADILRGNDAANGIAGGSGGDVIYGMGGDDTLFSGDRFDRPNAPMNITDPYTAPVWDVGTSVDTLFGGTGRDVIYAGYGDNVDGGTDGGFEPVDTLNISFMGATSGVTADFRLATQTIGGGVITGFERTGWVQGSNFNDVLTLGGIASGGSYGWDSVFAMGGNDIVNAGYYTMYIDGGDGNDTLDGRASQYLNAISGGNGDDLIYDKDTGYASIDGGAGADVIYAGRGSAHGGADNDTLYSSTGSGQLYGDDGNDQLYANAAGNDRLVGGNGADTLTGGSAADIFYTANYNPATGQNSDDLGTEMDIVDAQGGDDTIWAGYGDSVDGGEGTDTLNLSLYGATSGVTLNTASLLTAIPFALGGGSLVNLERIARIRGSEFADTITVSGLTATLTIDAGAGADRIVATTSVVNVTGGEGDDWLVSGTGADIFNAGVGIDTVDYSGFATAITANLSTGIVSGGAGNDRLSSVENLIGGSGNDTVTGSAAVNVISGGAGNDTISGGTGADTLNGDAGNDRLIVGAGADGTIVNGGADTDTLAVTGSVTLGGLSGIEAIELSGGATLTMTASMINTGLAAGSTLSGTGALVINMGAGDSELYVNQQLVAAGGSSVTVTVNGSSGSDGIKGIAGAVNIINGGDGADALRGGQMADTINGGNGNDKIEGGQGADILTGGAGADTFRYQSAAASGIGAAADRITDFVVGEDRLGFGLLDPDPVTPGDQSFSFIGTGAFHATGVAEIRYADSGADILVQADLNGDGVADMEIILQGIAGQPLSGADFVL